MMIAETVAGLRKKAAKIIDAHLPIFVRFPTNPHAERSMSRLAASVMTHT